MLYEYIPPRLHQILPSPHTHTHTPPSAHVRFFQRCISGADGLYLASPLIKFWQSSYVDIKISVNSFVHRIVQLHFQEFIAVVSIGVSLGQCKVIRHIDAQNEAAAGPVVYATVADKEDQVVGWDKYITLNVQTNLQCHNCLQVVVWLIC